MAKLEDLKTSAIIKGILPGSDVTVVDMQWFGKDVVEPAYKNAWGWLGNQLTVAERALGHESRDVSKEKLDCEIETLLPDNKGDNRYWHRLGEQGFSPDRFIHEK